MRKSFFILLCCFSLLSFSQSQPDISGTWNGTVGIPLGQDQLATYTFTQTGALIEGFFSVKSMNGRDSSKATISGNIKNDKIEIRSTDFIYKRGSGCLANSLLTYSKKDGIEKLSGRWAGDWGLTTCPPGTGGSIDLIKVIPPATLSEKLEASNNSYIVEENDLYGNALIRELNKRTYYGLFIAVDEYADDNIEDLSNAVKDATALKKVLEKYYSFSNENNILLTNPSRSEIIEAFDHLAGTVTKNDQLLIFYAGHGVWNKQLNQGYWLPADSKKDSKAQWLSNGTIRDYTGGIPSRHTVLVTDACFSGGILKERAVSFDNSKAMVELYKLPSRKAMTSGSMTTVPDNSVFIKYLLKSLANNQKPLTSAGELFDSFKIAVINNSPQDQVPQYAAISQTGDEGGDFIFYKK